MTGVRVTAIELPARWGPAGPALADVEARLARGPATDVVLLPEAALTGYTISVEAEDQANPDAHARRKADALSEAYRNIDPTAASSAGGG